MVLENSIADIVHQYVELFFRSERLQMYCLKWAHLLKKLLLGNLQHPCSALDLLLFLESRLPVCLSASCVLWFLYKFTTLDQGSIPLTSSRKRRVRRTLTSPSFCPCLTRR